MGVEIPHERRTRDKKDEVRSTSEKENVGRNGKMTSEVRSTSEKEMWDQMGR